MLFPNSLHEALRNGEVTTAFRRWKRPTVSEGGTLETPIGVLAIDELTPVPESELTVEAARAAGFHTLDEFLASLTDGDDRTLYRIRFHRAGDDPRTALRNDDDLDPADIESIDAQLDRFDAASRTGPWTVELLATISSMATEPSRILAEHTGTDQERPKRRVRRLKDLGLTKSLGTGYRLAPRGQAYIEQTSRSTER